MDVHRGGVGGSETFGAQATPNCESVLLFTLMYVFAFTVRLSSRSAARRTQRGKSKIESVISLFPQRDRSWRKNRIESDSKTFLSQNRITVPIRYDQALCFVPDAIMLSHSSLNRTVMHIKRTKFFSQNR